MNELKPFGMHLEGEILDYYQRGDEASRLLQGYGRLEFARTMDILGRYLPEPPAVILDVGGGSGVYAYPMAKCGHEVHLIDVVPLHIEQALQRSIEQPRQPLASVEVGDARKLELPDESVDAVLLFGPLYHLTDVVDRAVALKEALRVLKAGGLVFAAAISRFASTLQGLARDYLEDPEFAAIAERDLIDGQHRNPTDKTGYFTTAFFHHPDELRSEVKEAGFELKATLAVEGPVWMFHDIATQWEDGKKRQRLLEVIRMIEAEPSMLGTSAHIMAIGRKSG